MAKTHLMTLMIKTSYSQAILGINRSLSLVFLYYFTDFWYYFINSKVQQTNVKYNRLMSHKL